jgi:hypothetical protein
MYNDQLDPFKWRPWFAWYPVYIHSSGHKTEGALTKWRDHYVWLEWVEKKGRCLPDYRLPK